MLCTFCCFICVFCCLLLCLATITHIILLAWEALPFPCQPYSHTQSCSQHRHTRMRLHRDYKSKQLHLCEQCRAIYNKLSALCVSHEHMVEIWKTVMAFKGRHFKSCAGVFKINRFKGCAKDHQRSCADDSVKLRKGLLPYISPLNTEKNIKGNQKDIQVWFCSTDGSNLMAINKLINHNTLIN